MSNIVETTNIGKNFVLGEYSIVRRCVTIGDDTEIREHCVIGSQPFNFTDDGEKIPKFEGVKIGNGVFIGPFCNVSRGTVKDTIIEDNVLMNAYAMIGHDVHICKKVELMLGTSVSGHTNIGEGTFIGIGAHVRNRVTIGKNAIIGMGSVVVKDIPDNVVAYGNPCVVVGKKPEGLSLLVKNASKKIGRLI